jgi:hypothetical protein
VLSTRLLLLTGAIVAGSCALATAISGMLSGKVAAYPVFAAAALAGGALSARLTRRRTVAEGAIAATVCGLVTAVVNATVDELRLVDDPASRSAGWVIGAGAVCLVAAIAGGRLGERRSGSAPTLMHVAAAYGLSVAGMFFAGLIALYAIHEMWGTGPTIIAELLMLGLIPIAAAMVLVSVVDRGASFAALFLGSFSIIAAFGLAAITQVDSVAPLAVGGLAGGAIIAMLGTIGRPFGRRLRRRLGSLEPARSIAGARVTRR